MKLIIINKYRCDNNNEFPDNNVLKKMGHKISDLYKLVSSYYNIKNEDLLSDKIYTDIIDFLTEFALSSRYYNLDTLTNRNINQIDPLKQWSDIQQVIIERHYIKRKNFEKIISVFEKSVVIRFYDEKNNLVNNPKDYFDKMKILI